MKRQITIMYAALAVIIGLLAWTVVKLRSFDERLGTMGLMLLDMRVQNIPNEVRPAAIDEGDSFTLGDSAAAVTAIVFYDYECDYCKQFFASVFPRIERELIRTGRLRFVFRHFPIEMHPGAYPAAQMAEQARGQGLFREMHDRLNATTYASDDILAGLAAELRVDTAGWRTNPRHIAKIDADKAVGERIVVRGTPTFVINGKMYTGMRDYDGFLEIAGIR
jgi:protein-disulfide isomerase